MLLVPGSCHHQAMVAGQLVGQADAALRPGLALADPAGFDLVPLPRCARAIIQPSSYVRGRDGATAVAALPL